MFLHVVSQDRPVLASMHGPQSRCFVRELTIDHPWVVDLECGVSLTDDKLAQVAQAVLDVLCAPGAVGQEPNANSVEAVKLVADGEEEGTVLRADFDKAVGGGEKRAPLVVCIQGKVRLARLHDEPRRRELERELGREVLSNVACFCDVASATHLSVGSLSSSSTYCTESAGVLGLLRRAEWRRLR